MESQEMNKLIKKFYEGQTSLKEEEALQEYFNKPNTHTEDAAYFRAMGMLKSDYQSEKKVQQIQNPARQKRWFTKPYISFAATISVFVILAGLVLWLEPGNVQEPLAVRDEKPISQQEAKSEMIRAFGMISVAMQSSTRELRTIYNLNTTDDDKDSDEKQDE